jgi:diguanylate cyclase (GGDEF)-like protein
MKRKIAVFTNGWNDDYLDFALEGIRKRAAEGDIDVYVFLDYTSYDKPEDEIRGELNILNLPYLKEFDGVLLLGNTLNNAGENKILREKILAAGVPSVCLEYELEDINCIRTENINGMKELMEHMITVHDVKDVFWISGPSDNDESNARFDAIVETMEKHGLKFDPDRVFEGCWSYAIVEDRLPKVIEAMDKLPDVFMCANDSMALATCVVLEKAGYNVPRDTRVTGYDNLMSGNHFSPILTSVDRGWETRSVQATDSLIDLMNGGADFGDKVFDSKFDPGESCGCSMGEEGKRMQKEARQRAFLIPVERTIFDWHLIELDEAVAHVKSLEDIHEGYKAIWEKDHPYEGDDFYVCLNRDFVESMQDDTVYRTRGYSDSVVVIYGMKDKASVPVQEIDIRTLVPGQGEGEKGSSTYVFVPLHIRDESIGYFVVRDNTKLIKDFYLNSLTRHVSSGLERARQNVRLESLNRLLADISVRDELTGLYNRMGYEKIVIPYLDEMRKNRQKAVIMVADINRMKVINDKYGHLQGDTAIKIVANVIRSSVPMSWKAVRYGGDEYVIIGDYEGDIDKISNEIVAKAGNVSQELGLPFRLSVSVGYVVVDPDNTLGNEEYFRMADEAMYEMKKEAHRND